LAEGGGGGIRNYLRLIFAYWRGWSKGRFQQRRKAGRLRTGQLKGGWR
jgi:hypothetical protein